VDENNFRFVPLIDLNHNAMTYFVELLELLLLGFIGETDEEM
jgi:hypothetical protein